MTPLRKLRKALGPALDWPIPAKAHAQALIRGIGVLRSKNSAPARAPRARKHQLPEQPFDGQLLSLSKLYRKSRETYLKSGGVFRARLVTSPRTLSSPVLLEQRVEYSPIESEVIWAATDPIQKKEPAHLLEIREYASSLFHEQNHRILWKLLPPPPPASARGALRRYLNFSESLVIGADMALGDELGARVAPFFYLLGVTYDPGTSLGEEGLSRRVYRNYLHAAILGTYLHLELYSTEFIERALRALFPALPELCSRAADRSGNLDPRFIATTNPVWQKRFASFVSRSLARPGEKPLVLSDNPADSRLQYIITEKWLEKIGL